MITLRREYPPFQLIARLTFLQCQVPHNRRTSRSRTKIGRRWRPLQRLPPQVCDSSSARLEDLGQYVHHHRHFYTLVLNLSFPSNNPQGTRLLRERIPVDDRPSLHCCLCLHHRCKFCVRQGWTTRSIPPRIPIGCYHGFYDADQ